MVLGLQVVLGFMFRCYEQLASYFDYQTKVCYTVNRGQGLPPVQSCEGMLLPLIIINCIRAVMSTLKVEGLTLNSYSIIGVLLNDTFHISAT